MSVAYCWTEINSVVYTRFSLFLLVFKYNLLLILCHWRICCEKYIKYMFVSRNKCFYHFSQPYKHFFFISYVCLFCFISLSHIWRRHWKTPERPLLSNGWDLFYQFCLLLDLTTIIYWMMWLILVMFWDSLFKS